MEIIVGINHCSFFLDGVEVRTIYTLVPCHGFGFFSDHSFMPVIYDDRVRIGDVVVFSYNNQIVNSIEHVYDLDDDISALYDKLLNVTRLNYE